MKKLLLLFFAALTTMARAQAPEGCKVLMAVLPNMPQYKQFKLLAPASCDEGLVATYYSIGTHSDQQVFSIILTDTKPVRNQGLLGDAETKYDMAKESKDKTALKLSRFQLGAKSWVSHDVNAGIRRVYGYTTILKNRYLLEILLNNPAILNLDQFQDFISDYLSKFKEDTLPK
ncbi:MAG: hypothetical protein V4581_10610 [Bacteroidota bacterium]